MMNRLTYDDVADVARRLAESSDRPSAGKIREVLGRGGLTTIQKHLDTWRTSEEAKGVSSVTVIPMPDTLANDAHVLINQIWTQAKTHSDSELQVERELLDQERHDMTDRYNEVMTVSEDQELQIENLLEQVAKLESTIEDHRSVQSELNRKVDQAALTNATLTERCAQLEKALSSCEKRESILLTQLDKFAVAASDDKASGKNEA